MSLRWECPLCSRRLWWFQKACRKCAAKVALAAFHRVIGKVFDAAVLGPGSGLSQAELHDAIERAIRRDKEAN